MTENMKFQKKQLKKLREYKAESYAEAAIYTVLLDLIEGNSLTDVFLAFHNVANDLGKREELEVEFDKAKLLNWE
jgi:hypothetical protein